MLTSLDLSRTRCARTISHSLRSSLASLDTKMLTSLDLPRTRCARTVSQWGYRVPPKPPPTLRRTRTRKARWSGATGERQNEPGIPVEWKWRSEWSGTTCTSPHKIWRSEWSGTTCERHLNIFVPRFQSLRPVTHFLLISYLSVMRNQSALYGGGDLFLGGFFFFFHGSRPYGMSLPKPTTDNCSRTRFARLYRNRLAARN